MHSQTVDEMTGAQVFFKCENLQRAGAFKFRGAYNRLAQLTAAERAQGVVTHSSGNHAQGVALAARLLGITATIVMNSDAPKSKIAATRGYGAEVVLYDRLREDREAISKRISEERGCVIVPPYDDPAIMAGQGTAALELIEDVENLDILLAPLGGGGLLSGTATAARALLPNIRVYGVETEAADDWAQSLAKGEKVRIPPPDTIADGIRTVVPGDLTWPVVRKLVDGMRLVSEAEVKAAVRFLLLRMKLLVEPSGAVPAALLLSGRLEDIAGKRIGVILSGGNIDPELLCQVLAES
jgi:threonine dehydratase